MKRWLVIVVVIGAACSPSGHDRALRFDLSGLDLFWEVADTLATDRMPPPAQWDSLFQHPAYAQIQRSGQREPVLREVLPLVFMPSRRAALDSMLTGDAPPRRGGLYRRVARHLIRVRDQREGLMAYAAELESSELVSEGFAAARRYLPDMDFDEVTPPVAYVILFEENGFGGENLALDLLLVKERGTERNIAYLGHELHHAFLGRADPTRRPGDEPEAFVVHTLAALHYEGLASLIDKPALLDVGQALSESERENAAVFREFYAQSPAVLRSIDSVLVGIASGALDPDASGRALRGALPWGGHPTGLFMAQTVERAFGRDELVSLVDPFRFFLRYHDAALTENAPSFSASTLDYVRSLERSYVHSPDS